MFRMGLPLPPGLVLRPFAQNAGFCALPVSHCQACRFGEIRARAGTKSKPAVSSRRKLKFERIESFVFASAWIFVNKCWFSNLYEAKMFVEKLREEVYDVIINKVGSFEVVYALASKCEIKLCVRNQHGWPFYLQFAASFGSCLYGCGLLVCMQDSPGKRIWKRWIKKIRKLERIKLQLAVQDDRLFFTHFSVSNFLLSVDFETHFTS